MSVARRYWRFVLFFAVFAAATTALALQVDLVPAILGGFDLAVLAFGVAFVASLAGEETEGMRRRAAANEPDHLILVLIAAVAGAVAVVAVGFELTTPGGGNLALAAGTLFAAWVFGNLLFAIHYAHVFYLPEGEGDRGGLDFPGDTEPRYWDFAYFAFVLGMTFQVSDVAITAPRLRCLALVHGLIAFWFNLAVIALTVSLVGQSLA